MHPYKPDFRYDIQELSRHLEACPMDSPSDMVAIYFQEQFPNPVEAQWKLARFQNYLAYLKHSLNDSKIRAEFVTEHESGLIEISPDFMGAVWKYLGHAPDHLLGKAPPMPETLDDARERRKRRL